MADYIKPEREERTQKLQVWRCDRCAAIHFKAGNVLLNFTRGEFAELTNALMEIYQQEFGSLEFYDLLNSVKQREEALISQTIS